MKSSSLTLPAVALLLAVVPVQAETISPVAKLSAETNAAAAPLLAGLVLMALALVGTKIARRKLNRLDWDLFD